MTQQICKKITDEHQNVQFSQNKHNVGVAENFMNMVKSILPDSYDYYAFADQDDIWLPKKIITAVNALRHNNSNFYYSRVTNYDESCTKILYISSDEERNTNTKETATISPGVCGCTVLFDNYIMQLLHRYTPPGYPLLHDSWIYCISLFLGKVYYDGNSPQIKRRLTGSNVAGIDQRSLLNRVKVHTQTLRKGVKRPSSTEVRYLLAGYSDLLLPSDRKLLNSIASYTSTLSNYLHLVFSHTIRKDGFASNLFLHIRIALTLF